MNLFFSMYRIKKHITVYLTGPRKSFQKSFQQGCKCLKTCLHRGFSSSI